MRRPSLSLLCLMPLALSAVAAPDAALADEVGVAAFGPGYTAHDAPLGSPTDLRIELLGNVAARCRMGSVPTPAPLNLNRAGESQTNFTLDCNAPFRVRVKSEEGGLRADTISEGIAGLVAYDVGLTIGTDGGQRGLGWCSAEQLGDTGRAGCAFGKGDGWSSGADTAIDRTGTMSLRWADPATAPEMARGTYRDTVVIELSVRS